MKERIYEKNADICRLVLYGFNDLNRTITGTSTSLNKSQISTVFTNYVLNQYSQYYNSYRFKFNIPEELKIKILAEQSKVFLNSIQFLLLYI